MDRVKSALRNTVIAAAWRRLRRVLQPNAKRLFRDIEQRLSLLETERQDLRRTIDYRKCLYVRADFWNDHYKSGGSIGHSLHLINALRKAGCVVSVLSGIDLPGFVHGIDGFNKLPPVSACWRKMPHEIVLLAANRFLRQTISAKPDEFDFIYERPAMGNFLAAELSLSLGIPYVVEYNGPDVWICRHWANCVLEHESLFQRIEDANLQAADLIVVVSAALREQLLKKGIPGHKILVNPNGVDTAVFCPEKYVRVSSEIRQRYAIPRDAIVLGFIGSFGAWHGIDVLEKSLSALLEIDSRIHLLLIGDGPLRAGLCETIKQLGVENRAILTGAIPQTEAPAYLSACDIFLSPHSCPPADGLPFFGSPTKLFEYMAMNRPLIASSLGQIGHVVQPALAPGEVAEADGNTDAVGILVEPGNVGELVEAAKALAARPELGRRLAENSLRHVTEHYTWARHVERIIAHLQEMAARKSSY